jgi:hypothetical protein
MAYFNQYYNKQRYSMDNQVPRNYQVPGYYRNNTPSFQSPSVPQYGQPDMSNSMQTPGLSMNQGAEPPEGGEGQGGVSGAQVANYANAAIGGYQQGQQSTDNFSIDPNAGFKGSFQGLASGGVVGAIVSGISSQIGTFSEANKNLRNMDTNVTGYQVDAMGNPIFQGDAFNQANTKLSQLDEGEKAINKSFDPATRVFSGLYGTKKKIRKARRKLEAGRLRAQQQYDLAKTTSNQNRLSRENYDQSMDNYNRIYNLYNR